MPPTEHGKHIKWRIGGVAFDKLVDTRLIRSLLEEAIAAVGMRTLGEPHAYDIHAELQRQGLEPHATEPEGVTAFAVLSTSHAVIHTWPHRNYAWFDLFSCRGFEPGKVEEVLQEALSPVNLQAWDLSYSLNQESESELRGAAKEALNAIERWAGDRNRIGAKLKAALKK